jgi:tape measure domain-containing protein
MPTTDDIVTQFLVKGDDTLRATFRSLGGAAGALESQLGRLGVAGDALAAIGGYKLAGGVKSAAAALLDSSGKMEQYRAAFELLTGSADAGNKKIKELQQFAAKTPFSMSGLVENSKQLLAMGFTANELIPTMTALGNAMSALGGNDEMFGRVLYNLGQIRAQGKAYAVDLRQFAMAGINVAQVMEKATGQKMTQDQLTEMDGEEFIRDFMKGLNLTFGGMLDKMTNTLPGKLNDLGDAFERLKIDIGDTFSDDAKRAIDDITSGVKYLEKLTTEHPGVIKTFLYGAGGAAALTGGTLFFGSLAGAYKNLTDVLGGATRAKKALEAATKADTAAEAVKSFIAGKEGAAINKVGTAAKTTAAAKKALGAGATQEAEATAAAASKIAQIEKARIVSSKNLSRSMVALEAVRTKATAAAKAAQNVPVQAEAMDAARNVLNSWKDKAAAAAEAAKAAVGTKGETAAAARAAAAAEKVVVAERKIEGLQKARAALQATADAKAAEAARNVLEAEKKVASLRNARASLNIAGNAAKAEFEAAAKAEAAALAKVGEAAEKTASKLGMLSRVKSFLGKPIFSDAKAFQMIAGSTNEVTGLGTGIAGRAASLTAGGVATGAALGAFGAYNNVQDTQALGYSAAQSAAQGAFVGVGEAAVAMFVPGGAVAVGITEGLHLLFNKLYNEPMEKKAKEGNGLDQQTNQKITQSSPADRAAIYQTRADQLNDEISKLQEQRVGADPFTRRSLDAQINEKYADMRQAEENAKSWRNVAKQQSAAAEKKKEDAEQAKLDDWNRLALDPKWQRGERRRNIAALQEAAAARAAQNAQARDRRDGSRVVILPESRGDKAARWRHHATMTPMPSFS